MPKCFKDLINRCMLWKVNEGQKIVALPWSTRLLAPRSKPTLRLHIAAASTPRWGIVTYWWGGWLWSCKKNAVSFTSTCGKFLSEVLPQGSVCCTSWCRKNKRREMIVSYVPLGLAISFLKKKTKPKNKPKSFRVLFFFFLAQGTFSGNYYSSIIGRSQAASICMLSSSQSLCLEEERAEDKSRRLHGWSNGDGSRGRKVKILLALAVICCMYWNGHLVPLCLGFDTDKMEIPKSEEVCCGAAVSWCVWEDPIESVFKQISLWGEKCNVRKRKIRKTFKVQNGSKELLFCTLPHAHMSLENTYIWLCFFAIIQAKT